MLLVQKRAESSLSKSGPYSRAQPAFPLYPEFLDHHTLMSGLSSPLLRLLAMIKTHIKSKIIRSSAQELKSLYKF